MGCVYRALCNVSDKSYIGKSIKYEQRKIDHKSAAKRGVQSHFCAAIRKYGWDAFTWEILYESNDECELFEKEKHFIQKYDSLVNGYNMTLGGEGVSGCVPSIETRKKISESNKGKIFSTEHCQRLSDTRNRTPVLCLETNTQFSSIKDASRIMNLSVGGIYNSCKHGCACHGFHFNYI